MRARTRLGGRLIAWALVSASLLYFASLPVAGPLTDKGTQPPIANQMIGASDCGGCHGQYDDGQTEPWDTWSGTMMAQASRDALFWAALDVANNDLADSGDFCLRCHVPHGWLAGRSEPPGGSTDGCSFEGKLDETDKDFEGVSCHVCHRMTSNDNPPAGEDSLYFENAQYWIDDGDCGGEPCRLGPYDYPPDGNDPPPHVWRFSDYHEGSGICGNCHNVTNPVKTLIDEGTDTGLPYPIERTYTEWQQSDFSIEAGADFATCQNCHMPDATKNPAYACSDQKNNHSGDMPIHELVGGNTWMPDVLRQEYPNLNLSNELSATVSRALALLQNDSATIEVTAPPEVSAGGTLDASVKVTNLAGHKLPTGYSEGRRMWVHVVARDGLNNVIFESGAYDPTSGVLTKDAQIKVYETKPGIWNRNGTSECDTTDGAGGELFHFVINDCIAKDNRIPPKGFTGGADLETRPVAYSYPETSPGSGKLAHWDTTDYAIPVPSGTPSPITVDATLRFQTVSKEYVEFLLDQAIDNAFPDDCIERSSGFPTQSRAEILHEMWTTYDRAPPVDMVSDSASSTVAAATPGEASPHLAPMLVSSFNKETGLVTVSYEPACAGIDHVAYHGSLPLLGPPTFDDQTCGLGASGLATFDPGPVNRFWLIVANDGVVEGSYGLDSTDAERTEDTALTTCAYPQDLSARCDR